MFVTQHDLFAFFQQCMDGRVTDYAEVICPVAASPAASQETHWSRFRPDGSVRLDGYRTVDPVKMLFYQPREQVLPLPEPSRKRIVAGVKACDLKGLEVLDAAMLHGDFRDPVYDAWRRNTLLITTDCTDAAPSCHCTLVGGVPFVESGADIRLSPVDDGFVAVAESDAGRTLLDVIARSVPVREVKKADQSRVQENRRAVEEKVRSLNRETERGSEYGELRKQSGEPWPEVSETCVGCGACTNICPTCYCLILNDETRAEAFVKVRSFDSCQWHGYARVAGGDSPRPRMSQRFRNRYLCKFLFMQDNFDRPGCTGCGRCTDACAGRIDFRKVVKRLVTRQPMSVLHEPSLKAGEIRHG